MIISAKKKTELYGVIHEQVMKRRITVQQSKDMLGERNAENIDVMLHRLNQDIWADVRKTLNFNDT
jgi:hypothetical protein|tara:strand:+ start:336 stop:533 length:198 start_codon:yes stop_codon:yes gene_type:complete